MLDCRRFRCEWRPGASTITIGNTNADNEDFEPFTFGTRSFSTWHSAVPLWTLPVAVQLFQRLFRCTQTQAELTAAMSADPNGIAAEVTVNRDGSLSTDAVSPDVNFVPEPASLWLVSGPFLVLGAARFVRRRRKL